MKKSTIALIVVFLAIMTPRMYAQINADVFMGTIVDRNIFNFAESDSNLSFKTINGSIECQIWKNFGVGLYLGYIYNSVIQRDAAKQGFLPLAYPINYGIKAIFGNIDGGFAVALNIGINPTLGIYFKRYLLAIGWGYSEAIVDLANASGDDAMRTAIYPYIEVGYSYSIN